MKKIIQWIKTFRFPAFTFPLFLLLLCILSFGLLIPWVGFYWDDWAFAWISQNIGGSGLAQYFSTNRPIWGLLYKLTTPILGAVPWHWQVFAIFWRWVCAVVLWWLIRLTWPKTKEAAVWVSVLFVIYPGFSQQHIAITYGHFFIVNTLFFLSLALTVLALRQQKHRWVWTGLALALSLYNLLSMEYFFTLEIFRLALIGLILHESQPDLKKCAQQTLKAWLPYLAVFITAVFWRMFLFQYQTQNYDTVMLSALKTHPLAALLQILLAIFRDLWTSVFAAWGSIFLPPNAAELGSRTTQLYWVLILAAALLAAVYFLFQSETNPRESASASGWHWQAVGLGSFALLTAGWPFWITGLVMGLTYPSNRFTIPFMLGVSLVLAGLINAVPLRRWSKLIFLGLLVAFAVGTHFENANSFRRSWNTQKNLFWQMAWRMPALEPGTTLLANDLPVEFCSDNSLTSPLNWIYAPGNGSQQMSYMLYYPTVRLERGLKDLQPGLPIQQNYLATSFSGNTSQVIAIEYDPPACMRVLDPDIEPLNKMIPELMRDSARLTRTDLILSAGESGSAVPPSEIFGSEPAHTWCYYFEKADLARQLEDWETVAALGDEAFNIGDYPNDPTERMPFIEGYAQVGNWERALELTHDSAAITPLMQPLLCQLWERIDLNTPDGPLKDDALLTIQTDLGCQ